MHFTSDASNGCGFAAKSIVLRIDPAPPSIHSFSVSPEILWPPNHKMVEVFPSAQLSDNCGGAVQWVIESIRMNEGEMESTYDPLFDQDEQGDTADDIQVVDGRVLLRAERRGNSDGRVYTLTLRATDAAGNVSRAEAQVVVPHDQQ